MKALVTGATGFVGSALCRHLAGQGCQVIALSRSGGEVGGAAITVSVDLSRDEVPAEILAGVDVVYHLAGIAHRRAAARDYEQLNYRATLSLARRAEAEGVGCFIFLSSVKAMGPAPDERVRSEEYLVPPEDDYGRSKRAAESDLQRDFGDSPMSVVILRPALVYGPGARGNLKTLARAVQRGLPRPPVGGGRSMIALQDLVELMYMIGNCPPSGGVKTWIACDGEQYTTRDVYDAMRRGAALPPGRAWLPGWCWHLVARMLDAMRSGDGVSTHERLFGSELYSNAALRREAGWQPRLRFDQVVSDMMSAESR